MLLYASFVHSPVGNYYRKPMGVALKHLRIEVGITITRYILTERCKKTARPDIPETPVFPMQMIFRRLEAEMTDTP